MGFSIIPRKSGSRNSGKGYHKLRSIEDFSCHVNRDAIRYSVNTSSDISIPIQSTYNKRFSEQSYNTVSDISRAETYCSTSTATTTSTDYSYNNHKYNYNNNVMYGQVEQPNVQKDKKKKKHRKRKTLSKILQSFSLNDQLKQSMQCPDWEYYCTKENAYNI